MHKVTDVLQMITNFQESQEHRPVWYLQSANNLSLESEPNKR